MNVSIVMVIIMTMKIMLHDNFGDKEVEAGDDGHLLASNPLLTQQGHCQAWSGQPACRVPIDLKDLFKSRPIDQNTPVQHKGSRPNIICMWSFQSGAEPDRKAGQFLARLTDCKNSGHAQIWRREKFQDWIQSQPNNRGDHGCLYISMWLSIIFKFFQNFYKYMQYL